MRSSIFFPRIVISKFCIRFSALLRHALCSRFSSNRCRYGTYEADFSGEVDRLRADPNRGILVAASEDSAAVVDSMIVCKFSRKCFTDFYSEGGELLSKVTGWNCSGTECVALASGFIR